MKNKKAQTMIPIILIVFLVITAIVIWSIVEKPDFTITKNECKNVESYIFNETTKIKIDSIYDKLTITTSSSTYQSCRDLEIIGVEDIPLLCLNILNEVEDLFKEVNNLGKDMTYKKTENVCTPIEVDEIDYYWNKWNCEHPIEVDKCIKENKCDELHRTYKECIQPCEEKFSCKWFTYDKISKKDLSIEWLNSNCIRACKEAKWKEGCSKFYDIWKCGNYEVTIK